ncbi:MAG TPA: DUF1697 domain-containing protein [Steroidobacteraceae bacterium]|nr:DUF1697 domain-containing protein [Steroidobacteraceae bacterium]
MSGCVALIRGINVGRTKRISMADLRSLFLDLGFQNVRTLLNSGNVLFQYRRPNVRKLATAIESAISENCGFSAPVTVITAADLSAIIRDNPLLHLADDHARHLVAFATNKGSLAALRPLLKEAWAPDALAVSPRAAYLWCAAGVLDSRLSQVFARKAGSGFTTRNWATVLKLQAAAHDDE